MLFDAVPMTTVNDKPNNGKIIFDMLLHGKRTDPNLEDFIPSTSNVDEIYEEIKQDLEDIKKIWKENNNGYITKESNQMLLMTKY